MRNDYPKSYKGPKAGQSSEEEWVAVRDYDAFGYVANGTWTYSDFDCYLYCMCKKHYKLGETHAIDAFKAMHKITGVVS